MAYQASRLSLAVNPPTLSLDLQPRYERRKTLTQDFDAHNNVESNEKPRPDTHSSITELLIDDNGTDDDEEDPMRRRPDASGGVR
ncbi:hypothetical protein AAE478_002256 [Parahypoxylon ruwenzoriense]